MYTIRTAQAEEIKGFNLWDDGNEGDEILVAENEGKIVAFAQVTGNQIFFIESNARKAGTAIVNYLQAEYESLTARDVSKQSSGYWIKQGFERVGKASRPGDFDYEWYAD